VLPSQFIDRTKRRDDTFFGSGIVAHVSLGDPICLKLKTLVADSVRSLKLDGIDLHDDGTYLNMEGPAFSTKAESNMYRQWGATIIGMTNLTEAKLAREAEIAYASICMGSCSRSRPWKSLFRFFFQFAWAAVTDYDCWHPDHDNVTVEMVIKNLHKNAQTVQSVICETIKKVHKTNPDSEAFTALKFAIMTQLPTAPKMTLQKLEAILQKYL
jgi:5'-methylthioadenosine phosphorylase